MLKFHKLLLGLVLLILIVGASISVRAQGDDGLLVLDDPQTSYPVDLHLEYLEDPGGNLTINDVTGPEFAARFTPNTKKNPNFGLTSSAYWIRFHVRNETNQVYDWLLSFADARMGLIDLYYQPQGITGWKHQQAGRFLPATVREYIHPNFVFPLAIPPSHEGKIYLRLQANVPIRFSLSFWPAELFEQMGHGYFLALGLFYGIMLVMVVYNLMIFLFLKKSSYLYYVLFITVLALNTACIDGVAYVYLSPNWTHKYTLLCTTSLGSIFAALFIRDYLELKERVTWLDRVLIYLAASAGLLLLPFFFNLHTLENLAFLTLVNIPVLIAILAIVGSLIVWRQGLHTARYFLLGWLAFLSNVIIITLSILDLLPSSPVYDVTYNFSIVLMVVFLSLALADQINELRTNAIQAEQETRKSEERFRATFEQAAVGIANMGLDGHFLRVNQKLCDILGYTNDEMLNLAFQEITHPDDLEADLEYVAQLNAGLIPTYSMEKRYYTKDGQIVWVNLTVSLLWKENGKPDYAIAIVENITLRKQIELSLNESELKYRTLVEQANAGIIAVQEGKIIFANSFAEELSGYSVGELLNTPFISYIVEDEQPRVFDLYQQRMVGENVTEMYETVIKRKDGSRLEVEVNAGITLYDGKPGDLVIVRDITERKWLEAQRESALKALNESERKYRTLVEMANDAIVVIQGENIKFANTRFSQMAGCALEQLQDTHYSNYLPAEQLPLIAEMYQQREVLETPSIYETFIQRPDGLQLPVEFSASLTTYAGESAVLVFIRDITERKRSEEALRESDKRFRTTFEQAAVGIAHMALDGAYLRLNQKFCDIVGYSHEEMLARTFQDITHPDDLDADLEHKRQLLAGQIATYAMEKRYFKKDGQMVWINLTVSLVQKVTGEPDYFVTVIEDITARKQAEDALQERKERYRQALESGYIMLWQWDMATDHMELDGAVERILGYTFDELDTGAKQNALIPPEEVVMLQKAGGDLLEGRSKNYNVVHRMFHKDGSVVWLEANGSVIKDKQGQAIGILGTSRDITATKQAEELVARSQSVGQVGSWELDLASNQLTWSNEVYRIFGLDLGTVVPTYEAFLDHVHPEDRAVVDAAYSDSIREGKDSYEIEHRLVRPATGEIRWVLEKCDHIRDESGQIVSSIGVVQDITERRKTEEALYQSREQLAILNRASQTINMAGLDSEQVYVAMRAACAWMVPADVVAISLVDYAAGEVEDVYVMERDRHLPGSRHPLNGSFIGEVLANGVSIRVDDFHTRPNTNQYTNWIKYSPNVRSGMAILLRGSKENLGVLTVQSYAPNAYTEDDQPILESFASHASITLENIYHYKQLEKSAVIEERQRLASDLHDSVTQLLYSIALMSSGWGLKASQDQLPDPAEHFHQIEELSLQALKELRMLIHQLHPPVLADVGLLKALEDRLDRVERRVEIQASIHIEGGLPRLTALVEEEIYFIILEALNNSLRHARASTIQINIHAHEKQLHISVVDNGRGFDTSLPSKGMGTAILNNRAATIGAKITRHSQPGQGTRIDLVVGI